MAAAWAATSWAQDDPFGGASGTKPSTTGNSAVPTPSGAGPLDWLPKAISEMKPADWVWFFFSLVGAWILGWVVFYLLVKRRGLPSNSARFGCFSMVSSWLLFMALVFFVYIVPATMPEWLLWAVLGVIVLAFLIVLITRKKR